MNVTRLYVVALLLALLHMALPLERHVQCLFHTLQSPLLHQYRAEGMIAFAARRYKQQRARWFVSVSEVSDKERHRIHTMAWRGVAIPGVQIADDSRKVEYDGIPLAHHRVDINGPPNNHRPVHINGTSGRL